MYSLTVEYNQLYDYDTILNFRKVYKLFISFCDTLTIPMW